MLFTQVIVAFCFSSLVLAKDHNGGKNGTAATGGATSQKGQCEEMSKLTKLTDLANNATKLSELETKFNLTAAQINDIKTEAANATSRLQELQSNTTLTSQ